MFLQDALFFFQISHNNSIDLIDYIPRIGNAIKTPQTLLIAPAYTCLLLKREKGAFFGQQLVLVFQHA